MPFNYLLANGKAHTSSFIRTLLSMESLKGRENLVDVLLFETDAVVLDHDLKLAIVG